MKRIINVFVIALLFAGTAFAGGNKLDRFLEEKRRSHRRDEKVRVIIQHLNPVSTTDLDHVERKHGGKVWRRLAITNSLVAEVLAEELDKLKDGPNVAWISADPIVDSTAGTPRVSTGASVGSYTYNVDGDGIGVAVIDSGFADRSDIRNNIVKVVDFVDDWRTSLTDPFGHGTHVAGIIASSGRSSDGRYKGIAPEARLIDLRVLDRNGRGYTSDVIAAIEWAVENRYSRGTDWRSLNIRVINLSLGHRPYESAETDPLAIACRRAVQAGIVVVAAAGNYGQDGDGDNVFGGITSPGTEPSVITVGAMRTWGTDSRNDDRVAPYSSRGPTFHDRIVKPDIAAPGSNVVSLLSPNSLLANANPNLVVDSGHMMLSGTSMATAVVSGTVALILDENPSLTPNAVKAILMYTAEDRSEDPLEIGAGYINAFGALNLAANIDTRAKTSSYWIVNNGTGLDYTNMIAGSSASWSQTIVWAESLCTGNILLYNQPAWSQTIVWSESTTNWATTIVWSEAITSGSAIGSQTIVWEVLDLSLLPKTVEEMYWDPS